MSVPESYIAQCGCCLRAKRAAAEDSWTGLPIPHDGRLDNQSCPICREASGRDKRLKRMEQKGRHYRTEHE